MYRGYDGESGVYLIVSAICDIREVNLAAQQIACRKPADRQLTAMKNEKVEIWHKSRYQPDDV